jgi:geranylgeranyl reductase family protein
MRRTRRAKSTIFSLVSRVDLDAELVRVATEGGARFVPQVTVTRVEQEQGVVRLATSDGRSVRARAVVGADGSASRIGAHVGVSMEQVDLGLELEIPVPPSVADDWAHRVHIDWGPIPGSYGWVFPKGDTLTVGVIAARGNGEATRGYLADFVGRLGLAGFEPAVSSGQLTRCRAEDSPLARGRVLVAGDAAGLLEPWTREGISFALRSGRLAGEWAVQVAEQKGPVAVKREALNYEFAVKAGLGEEMRAGRRFLAAFARRPGAFHGAITTFRPAWSAFTEVVAGRSTFGLVLQRYAIARRALELVER